MRSSAVCALVLMLLLGCGCTVGPRYSRPPAPAPAPDAWKTQPPWEQAAPKDAIPKGAWWEVFHDAALDDYEQQLLKANQSLIAARDNLSQARSLARVATAGYFPQLTTDPNAYRERGSGNRPLNGFGPTTVNGVTQIVPPYTENVFTIPFSLTWETDLFGRVRRSVEAANATLQSTAADLGNAQLVLTAELAADYFSLRELDAEYQVVEESVGYQRKGLELVEQRHNGGIASGLEVAQQATVLDSTISQAALVQESRAQYEHAIAVLVGQPASSFSIPVSPLNAAPPPVPLGVPSDVLERRPDIASYERQIAYENAQVGLAKAAFYPHITLGGTGGGWQSTSLSTLVNAPSLFWSIGADAFEPILQGGRNRANLAATRAAYDQSVANYRQTVLTAFQQVEDGISNLSTVSQALTTQAAAVDDARRALEIANNRYVGGVTNYLDVITAQTTLLSNQRLQTQLLGQQMVNSVYLVKALGGGWNISEITNQQVHPHAGQVIQQ
ncbi:MAG TPA: efflux transporter outer membrane subunit [Verrucomicrobiae bacterium]|jgi:outer membrane protein, multidrug efflux system|nr:efflux transporter outer membrane subunit [Verrucomicrobiae bacterium]